MMIPFFISKDWKISINEIYSAVGIVGLIVIISVAIYAFKISLKLYHFAYDNFEEIISKRTKWKTSNIEQHEMRYRFALKVLGYSFFCIIAPVISIVYLFGHLLT